VNAIDDPVSTLAEIDQARERTRASLRSIWFPLVLFGAATLGAAAFAALYPKWIGAYWLVAYTGCFIAVGRYYAARVDRIGVVGESDRRYVRAWLAFPVALLVVGGVAGSTGGEPAAVAAEAALVGAWYLMIAWWERSSIMAVLGVAVAVIGAVLAAIDATQLVALANLVIGAVLVAAGVYALGREEAP
jgi:hypothetical protein